jgi:hypothetical protein
MEYGCSDCVLLHFACGVPLLFCVSYNVHKIKLQVAWTILVVCNRITFDFLKIFFLLWFSYVLDIARCLKERLFDTFLKLIFNVCTVISGSAILAWTVK